MTGRFNPTDAEDLLVACHRRCCVCHRLCGTKIELDHIEARADGGDNNIDNAIALCFECHADVKGYNPKHPRGRKFQPSELRKHRDQWLAICRTNPAALLAPSAPTDVGPVQALIDELSFNRIAASSHQLETTEEILETFAPGAPLADDQFKRAISSGALALLGDDIRNDVMTAYVMIGRLQLASQQTPFRSNDHVAINAACHNVAIAAIPAIDIALGSLFSFLGREDADQ